MGSFETKGDRKKGDWHAFATGLLKSFEGNHQVQWARPPELTMPKRSSRKPKDDKELVFAIIETVSESDAEFLLQAADLLCNAFKWTDGFVPDIDAWKHSAIEQNLEFFAFLNDTRGKHIPLERRIKMAHRYLLLIALNAGTPDTMTVRKILNERLSHIAVE